MAADQKVLGQWFDLGVKQGATHMIVLCDTFDWEDYPVYVTADEDVRDEYRKAVESEDRVMELYNLSMDRERQVNTDSRVLNF